MIFLFLGCQREDPKVKAKMNSADSLITVRNDSLAKLNTSLCNMQMKMTENREKYVNRSLLFLEARIHLFKIKNKRFPSPKELQDFCGGNMPQEPFYWISDIKTNKNNKGGWFYDTLTGSIEPNIPSKQASSK